MNTLDTSTTNGTVSEALLAHQIELLKVTTGSLVDAIRSRVVTADDPIGFQSQYAGSIVSINPIDRRISLSGNIMAGTVELLTNTLVRWNRVDRATPRPIHISLSGVYGERDNFGEGFINTFALIDVLTFMRERGHRTTVHVEGIAARQAVHLLQAADVRSMTPNSWLNMSRPSFPAFNMNTDEYYWMEFRTKLEEMSWQILENPKLSVEMIQQNTPSGTTWRLNAKRAYDVGLIDRIEVPLDMTPVYTLPTVPDGSGSLHEQWEQWETYKLNLLAESNRLNRLDVAPSDDGRRCFCLFDVISVSSVSSLASKLQACARCDDGATFEIWLNSPGGDVDAGMALIDLIERIKSAGRTVRIIVVGQASSMAGYILQAASEGCRIVGKNSWMLIHSVSSGIGGDPGQQREQMKHMRSLESDVLCPLMASRTGGKLEIDEIMALKDRRDVWFPSDVVLEKGLADVLL